jgi:hypothetical protein
MSSVIIAICGSKRSGKDTLAGIISNEFGFEHVKIAQKLKAMCQILFNFSNDQIETDLKDEVDPKWNISPRRAMQFMGTEVMQYKIQDLLGKRVGREFWIDSLLESFEKENHKYVISDLRFIHEYTRIKEKRGFIIKVIDNDLVNEDDHISEQEYLEIKSDVIIDNTGRPDLESLRRQIAMVMKS